MARLPHEIWEQIFSHCSVPDLMSVNSVCRSFRAITDTRRPESLLWKEQFTKLCRHVKAFQVSPIIRSLKGETHFEIVAKYVAWTCQLRLERISKATEAVISHPVVIHLPPLPSSGQRRVLVAEPISHVFLIRWSSLWGPLVYFHKEPQLKVMQLETGQFIDIDERLIQSRFLYAVPQSNWVVFQDSAREFQLGYLTSKSNNHTEEKYLEYMDSSLLQDVVSAALAEMGNGQILPLRGYKDTLVIGLRPSPDGNQAESNILLAGISLKVSESDPIQICAERSWNLTLRRATSLFVDNHNEFMIFRFQERLREFKVVSIEEGVVVAGDTNTSTEEPKTMYSALCANAYFMTCTRFYLLSSMEGQVKLGPFSGTSVSVSVHENPSESAHVRHIMSDDGALLASVSTRSTYVKERGMIYDFYMKLLDPFLGTTSIHQVIQSSGDSAKIATSGIWLVYEDLKDGAWSREICFLEFK